MGKGLGMERALGTGRAAARSLRLPHVRRGRGTSPAWRPRGALLTWQPTSSGSVEQACRQTRFSTHCTSPMQAASAAWQLRSRQVPTFAASAARAGGAMGPASPVAAAAAMLREGRQAAAEQGRRAGWGSRRRAAGRTGGGGDDRGCGQQAHRGARDPGRHHGGPVGLVLGRSAAGGGLTAGD